MKHLKFFAAADDSGLKSAQLLVRINRRGRMKKIFVLIIGFGFALAASATFASSAPVDPSVIINSTLDPTESFTTNSATDPLVITLGPDGLAPLISVGYDGTSTLNELFVQLDGALVGEQFFCQSNIFTGQCGTFSTGVGDDVGLIFTGGTLTPGADMTVQVSAPEPRSWLLLMCSMVALLFVGRFCWEPNRG